MRSGKVLAALLILFIVAGTVSAQEQESVEVSTPSDLNISQFEDANFWLEISCSDGYSDENMRFTRFEREDENNHGTVLSELRIPKSVLGKGKDFTEFSLKEISMERTGDDGFDINVQLYHRNLTESFEGERYCRGDLRMKMSGFEVLPKPREFTFNVRSNTTSDSTDNAVDRSVSESIVLFKDWETEYIKEDGSTLDWDGNEEAYHNHHGHDHHHPPNCDQEDVYCDFQPDHTAKDHFDVCHKEARLDSENGNVYVDEENCQDNYEYPGDAEMVCDSGSGETVYVESLNCQKDYLHRDHIPGSFNEQTSDDLCSSLQSQAMDKMDGTCTDTEKENYNFGEPKAFVCPYDQTYSINVLCSRMEDVFTADHDDITGWEPWSADVETVSVWEMMPDEGECQETTISTVEFNNNEDDYFRSQQECKNNIPIEDRNFENTVKKCEAYYAMLMEGSEEAGTYSEMCGEDGQQADDRTKYKCAYNNQYKTGWVSCMWAQEELSESDHFTKYMDFSDKGTTGVLESIGINQRDLAMIVGLLTLAGELATTEKGDVFKGEGDEITGVNWGNAYDHAKSAVSDAYTTTKMVMDVFKKFVGGNKDVEGYLFGTDPQGEVKGPSIPTLPEIPSIGDKKTRFTTECDSDSQLAIYSNDQFPEGDCISPNEYCQNELSDSYVWDLSSGVGKVENAEDVCIEKENCADSGDFWNPEKQKCWSKLQLTESDSDGESGLADGDGGSDEEERSTGRYDNLALLKQTPDHCYPRQQHFDFDYAGGSEHVSTCITTAAEVEEYQDEFHEVQTEDTLSKIVFQYTDESDGYTLRQVDMDGDTDEMDILIYNRFENHECISYRGDTNYQPYDFRNYALDPSCTEELTIPLKEVNTGS